MAIMENENRINQLRQDRADSLRRGDLVDPYPDTLSPAERISATEAFSLYSVESEVPRDYLWGRQHPREFTRSPEYRIKSLYGKFGKKFLVQKPVWAVLNPNPAGDQSLIIVDGHKRTRYAPLFGIDTLPTEVISMEHLAAAWEQTPEQLQTELSNQAAKALARFEQIARGKGKDLVKPLSLPHGLAPEDLSSYFESIKPKETQVPVTMQPSHEYVLHGRR